MPSAWVEHVKEWSKTKEMKYGEAMRHPECKASYQKTKPNADNGHKFEKNPDDDNKVIKPPKKVNIKKEVKVMNPDETETVEAKMKKETKPKKPRMSKKMQV